MDQTAPLYFKHVYGTNLNDWGALGFPTTQTPTRALREYASNGQVLLAMTKDPDTYPELIEAECKGTIFAICTLLRLDGRTSDLAKPDLVRRFPLVVERWPHATPIDRMWRLAAPISYDKVQNGELTQWARQRRGELLRLQDRPDVEKSAKSLLTAMEMSELNVFHSKRTLEFMSLHRDP